MKRVTALMSAFAIVVIGCSTSKAPIADLITLAEDTCRVFVGVASGEGDFPTVNAEATDAAQDLGYSSRDLNDVLQGECPAELSAVVHNGVGPNLVSQGMGIESIRFSTREWGVIVGVTNENDQLTLDLVFKISYLDEDGAVIQTEYEEIEGLPSMQDGNINTHFDGEDFADATVELVGIYLD